MRETTLPIWRGTRHADDTRGVPPPSLHGHGGERAAAWPAVLLAGVLTCVGAALVAPPSRETLLAAGVVLLCVAVRMRLAPAARASHDRRLVDGWRAPPLLRVVRGAAPDPAPPPRTGTTSRAEGRAAGDARRARLRRSARRY